MIWPFVSNNPKRKTLDQAQMAEGIRAYAIGDIHGCIAAFDALLEVIAADRQAYGGLRHHLILLGDLIDRGPDSRAVVERCLSLKDEFDDFTLILGNHEHALIEGLRTRSQLLRAWLHHGGVECAASYGISPSDLHGASGEQIASLLRYNIPKNHLDFLATAQPSLTLGDYFFVHAGVRPGRPLDKQERDDMLFIREPFLNYAKPYEKIIVHGHTISEEVELESNRIGLDTGSYASGKLSAVALTQGLPPLVLSVTR
jgi:serine/threonine protein phosphatase 1